MRHHRYLIRLSDKRLGWRPSRPIWIALFGFALLGLTACGDATSNQATIDDQPGQENDGTVDQALDTLGVDTTMTPRVDDAGEPLPEDYSPIGASTTVAQTDELFLVGMRLVVETPAGTSETLDNKASFIELIDDDTGVIGPGILEVVDRGDVWEGDQRSSHPSGRNDGTGSQSLRAAAAGDIDGDGVDELAVVYVDLDNSPEFEEAIFIEVLDDMATDAPSAAGSARLTTRVDVRDIAATMGDFDGDGVDEIAVGVSTTTGFELSVFARTTEGELVLDEDASMSFEPFFEGGSLSIELAAGNLDRDNGEELVAVLNQFDSSEMIGIAAYSIFDDAGHGYATLVDSEEIEVREGVRDLTAQVADVAIGDVDGDGMGEVLFGGLTEVINDSCASTEHIYFALDDASSEETALQPIGEAIYSYNYIPTGTGCDNVANLLVMRHVHVNTFDVDGDGIDEVQANLRVFEDFSSAAPFTEIYSLPDTETLSEGQRYGGVFSAATTDMAVGDVNADGREDLISFVQWRGEISVWGLRGPSLDTATWSPITTVETEFYNSQSRVFPIIVRANVDRDGLALRYSDGEHRFVFTEPIIIAALAAAPCNEGIGQNTAACVTSFGTSESSQVGVDGTVTVSASTFVSVEARDPFLNIGAGARSEVTTTASFSAGLAYTLEETVEFTTGPLEDTVVFTTIPMDQYIYTVLSHPDPDMVGETIVINMPRSPITLQVEREFYNRSVPNDALQVGSNVFLHTPGDLDSYPTEADADILIDTGGLGHLGPLGEIVDSAGEAMGPIVETLLGNGLKASRVTTVGQGTGQTSTEIRFSENTSYRAGVEVSYEAEFDVSGGGVSVGTSIGGSVGAGISWGGGTSTIYRGSVGSIDTESFGDQVYSFGLFTYIFNYGDPSRPQFEVVNYWVDR